MAKNTKGKLMVIDGNSLIYRAFYALPLLSTKDGIYTNGVYGFLTMFYRIREEYDIDYLCVAFDKKGPTFRHKAFDQYKATRKSTPNELVQQFPMLKEILTAMNIPQLELDGYEADDIAGTLASLGEENQMEVILVTGDNDYLQLTSDHTKVLISKKGISELEEYDKNRIMEEYGLRPDQLIDLKGLMGDSSDNIPGVPGIGEKTGIKLLKEFGSMENIYENLDKVSGKKRKESLIENQSLAFLSRKLGEIIRNVPIDLSFEELKVKEPNWQELADLYTMFEFNSLLSKIPEDKIIIEDEIIHEAKHTIIKDDNYKSIIEEIKNRKRFCFELLFTDNYYINSDILGIGIKVGESNSYYIDFSENNIETFVKQFKEYFESKEIEKYGHMMKKNIYGLFKLEIAIKNIGFDTMIGQYLLNPAQTNYSVNELGKEYLDLRGLSEEELLGKGKNKKTYEDLSIEKRAEHTSSLLDLVYKLRYPMNEKIKEQEMAELYYGIELPLVEVLANMEFIGFKVDLTVLKELGNGIEEEINSLTEEIYDLAGEKFNIKSPKQMGVILFDKLNLPIIKKTKTGYSTDAEVLDKLKGEHEIIEKILRYRQIVKLKSTYIDGLIDVTDKDTEKIYSTFNQTVTNTGRISSTEPNLQNIPIRTEEGRKIRKAFVPRNKDYILVDGDYSQIELRVLAHISQDPKLIEAFKHNEDIHTKTASEVFNLSIEEVTPLMRNRAKAVNFGIVYGISDYGLSKDLDITRKEAKEYIDNYLKNYKMVDEYMDNIKKIGKEKGYVETILNRRRYVPELKSRNFNVRSFGERIAMNTPIQGSAADIIKIAMVKVYEELNKRNLKSKLILQVHDELIIETHRDEEEEVKEMMIDIMENAVDLDILITVDLKTGENWHETN